MSFSNVIPQAISSIESGVTKLTGDLDPRVFLLHVLDKIIFSPPSIVALSTLPQFITSIIPALYHLACNQVIQL